MSMESYETATAGCGCPEVRMPPASCWEEMECRMNERLEKVRTCRLCPDNQDKVSPAILPKVRQA